MRVFVVHGYRATPQDHWFPWLAQTLEAQGHPTRVLAMADPTAPVRQAWERTLDEQIGHVDEDTVLVTHSLGTITALRWLLTLEHPWTLRGLVTVAGFVGPLDALPELDDHLASTPAPADLALLADAVDVRVAIFCDDDVLVPPAASRSLALALHATMHEVVGGGHSLADEGHTELVAVLRSVEVIDRT